MDPSFKDYFEKLITSLDAIHIDLCANTMAINTTVAKLDDLVQWHPDLERRVEQLSIAVAKLQHGRPMVSEEEQAAKAARISLPAPHVPLRGHVGSSADAEGVAVGSFDRDIDVLPWGLASAFALAATPTNVHGQEPASMEESMRSIIPHVRHPRKILGSNGFAEFFGQPVQRKLAEFD
ncbi:hypothetical protein D1007_00105 [Hordeum vulgare]|nr:hypothetical protein D1007_00105 [Hordeum vulgare]